MHTRGRRSRERESVVEVGTASIQPFHTQARVAPASNSETHAAGPSYVDTTSIHVHPRETTPERGREETESGECFGRATAAHIHHAFSGSGKSGKTAGQRLALSSKGGLAKVHDSEEDSEASARWCFNDRGRSGYCVMS